MVIPINKNSALSHDESPIFYNNFSYHHHNSQIFSELLTIVDRLVFNYSPSSIYREETIIRYNHFVNIIRNIQTMKFSSREDYHNALIKEFSIKSIYSVLRIGLPFLSQLINQKVKDAKNTAINGNRNPSIAMKPNNVIYMYKKFNFNNFEQTGALMPLFYV